MAIPAPNISPRGVYLALGVFSVALLAAMGYVMLSGASVGYRYVPLVRASGEIKLNATLAHLWFEEILSGDRHESMQEVWHRLEQARFYARAMIASGRDAQGEIAQLKDPRLRGTIRNVEKKLAEFAAITRQRHATGPNSVSGTEIDQEYDAVFGELLALAGEVEHRLHQVIRDDTLSVRRVQFIIMAGALALSILVGVVFSRYMNEREQAERTLRSKARAEKEAREHLERLAHVVRVSTMSELAAGIAHELNQPLAAISASAAACRRLAEGRPAADERQLTGLKLIGDEAERASDILHRLRAFVRKRDSCYELVDVNGLVRSTVKLVGFDPRLRRARIHLELAEGLPPAEADEIQMQQVLLNLVQNGFEAMREIDVEHDAVRVRTRVGEDGEIEVSVADRGCGVPAEIARDPCRPFVTTKESGMGMGLSISKSIIDAHGGRIWFHRNRSGGTTFHFTLPAAAGQAP